MPAKIRLQRYGKKGMPFYHIVIADGRAPRDGRYIEKIGAYNSLTIPATIDIDFDKAIDWLNKGAQPTNTVRAILSYKGVMYKNHLIKGVKKGVLTEQQAEAKFEIWVKEKEAKVSQKANQHLTDLRNTEKKRKDAESKINEERAKALAEKREKAAEKALKAKEEAESGVVSAEAAPQKTPQMEVNAVQPEETVSEVKTEEPQEEIKEEVVEEAAEETKEEPAENPEEKTAENPEEEKKEE